MGNAILAPMAGITGFPFRKMALKYGADFCFTEMVSALGFLHNDKSTLELTAAGKNVEKTGIQLFGSSPDILARAAEKAVDAGFKVIDVNMGCPVKKVVKTGAGSAILKDVKEFASIVKSVRSAVGNSIFTIKIRSGFDENSVNFIEIGAIAGAAGVDAIFFHPRTRAMMFGGAADHSLTKILKDSIKIPIYATGDIFTKEDAIKIKKETGVDGIMFARGSIGKPWIFTEYCDAAAAGVIPSTNKSLAGIKQKTEIVIELMEEMSLFYGKERGHRLLRPHLYNFIKGFRGSKALRYKVNNAQNEDEIRDILKIIADEEYCE